MNIAELFVRVRGDVSDVDRQMGRVQQSLNRVDSAARGAQLSTGRLGNQFANLAGHIAGVHPIVGNLASVLGNFAIGGLVTVGVLGGLAAIAVAYDKLTESSRNAMKASDKLIESLLRTARIRALGVGGESKAAIEDLTAGGAAHAQRAGFLSAAAASSPALGFLRFFADKDVQKVVQGSKAMQEAVNQLGLAIAASNEKIASEAEAVASKAEAAAARRRSALERDAAEEAHLQKQIADIRLRITLDELAKIAALHAEILGQSGFTGMPNVSMPFEGLTDKQKENLKQLGVIEDDANKNAADTQAAIWGAAIQSANIIAGALNIGGGGKGSNLGGAIGSTAGFAVGFAFGGGPVGGAIGSLVGNIAGSFIGGLFDHKKAIETNTAAVRQNTMALLQNAPSVYKVGRGRFDSTEIKQFRQGTVRYNTRGGAPVMVVP